MIVSLDQQGANSLYHRMNNQLINSYKRIGLLPNLSQHTENFEQEYNVRVIVENSRWAALEFPSEQAYLLAILKWSYEYGTS